LTLPEAPLTPPEAPSLRLPGAALLTLPEAPLKPPEAVINSRAVTIADLGEFGLIAAIREVLPAGGALLLGAGDDAAVLRAADGRVVASTDLLVEGRHFRRDWSGPRDVGSKAAAQNLADIAAMGASPTGILVGLAAPGELTVDWVLEMMRGMVAECERAGASLAGGDISGADAIMLGVTALGDLGGREPVTRSGARPGDQVAISGRIGWSAAGLALLRAGHSAGSLPPDLAELVRAHLRPRPDYTAGPQAAMSGATAMIDVSDGLLADLGHVCSASGVSVNVLTSSLPVAESVRTAAALLGEDWLEWTLAGGEDHALAATFPAKAVLEQNWTVIGGVQEGGEVLVDSAVRGGRAGWDHFR
jgi:thiamine-monophosphate kinase